jgi:hypothetical protein
MDIRAHPLLVPALTLLACGTPNLSSVEPAALCAEVDPQPQCTYQATCALVNMDGRLGVDLTLVPYLWAPIQYNNQNPNNADPSTGRVNTRDAYIERFDMHYAGALALPDAQSDQTVLVPAAGSQTAGVHIIPPSMVTIMTAALTGTQGYTEVIAEVKARGHYTDGTTFVTGSMQVPIDVCVGCYGPRPTCTTAGNIFYCCPQYGQSDAHCKCM